MTFKENGKKTGRIALRLGGLFVWFLPMLRFGYDFALVPETTYREPDVLVAVVLAHVAVVAVEVLVPRVVAVVLVLSRTPEVGVVTPTAEVTVVAAATGRENRETVLVRTRNAVPQAGICLQLLSGIADIRIEGAPFRVAW